MMIYMSSCHSYETANLKAIRELIMKMEGST